jgi:hemerythrin-like domain-containing protein
MMYYSDKMRGKPRGGKGMGKAIEDLQNEHQAIISGLQILDTFSRRIDRGLDVQRRDIHDIIGFLKEFADTCHHGKEEGILFPALINAGMEEKGGPIEAMLLEHAKGRELIKEMDIAVSGKEDHERFTRAAREYSDLLQAHIAKENGVLFPSAENTLTAPQLDQIYEAFEQHERKVIGIGRHEELHAMLKKLKQKYSA